MGPYALANGPVRLQSPTCRRQLARRQGHGGRTLLLLASCTLARDTRGGSHRPANIGLASGARRFTHYARSRQQRCDQDPALAGGPAKLREAGWPGPDERTDGLMK